MASGNSWSSGQVVAALCAGAAAGAVFSRVLPPMLAAAAGSVRGAAGTDPFAALVADHRHLLALLAAMEQSRRREVFNRTQLLLRLKRRMTAHALAEEDVVYPLLHDEAKAEQDARQLYAEHADMKMLLYALDRMPKDDPRWIDRLEVLKGLVARHVRHEEEVDFPRLRAALADPQRARMARDLGREKAFVL